MISCAFKCVLPWQISMFTGAFEQEGAGKINEGGGARGGGGGKEGRLFNS